MKTPTLTAIETAIARAETMHGEYTCEAMPSVPGYFYVQHNEEAVRCYIVQTTGGGHCSCPQFEKAAVCKHQAFVHECNRIAEGEEEAAERCGFSPARRGFSVGCGPDTHPTTGARLYRVPLDRAEPRDD